LGPHAALVEEEGAVVEVEIDNIGVLRNPIANET
jgi:hypothetical protein